MEEKSRRRIVSVWTSWGDYVLGVRDVRHGESLNVGTQVSVRFLGGRVRVRARGAAERELCVGQSVTVTVEELVYTVSCSAPEAAKALAPLGRRWALLDAAALAVLIAVCRGAPDSGVPSDGGLAVQLGPVVSRLPAEPPPFHEPLFAVVTEPEAESLRLPGDMRCGDAEMGAHVEAGEGRYGVAGPADNADARLARPLPGLGHRAAQGALAEHPKPQAQPGSNGPTAQFGRDDALGRDPKGAQGDMWGEELQEARGENGLGVAGRAGGVLKRFDVAPLADERSTRLRVLHTGLRVTGARKASEVGRVMAARFGEFRACAEGVEPAGRDVELGFDVDEAGRAVASGSGAGALERCLDQAVAGATFSPGASEKAHVVYPLHFVAADERLKGPPLVRPSAPEPCNCGG